MLSSNITEMQTYLWDSFSFQYLPGGADHLMGKVFVNFFHQFDKDSFRKNAIDMKKKAKVRIK